MKNRNMIKLETRWCSVLLVVVLSLVCINVWGQDNVKFTLLKVDSVPAIKAIENMQIVGNRFCITYEEPKRWGSQLLRTYVVDETSQSLKFEHEYFRNPATSNGIDYPVLFQGNLGNAFVMDRTYPLVYQIDLEKHVMQNTHKFVFSAKSKVPYGMALNVPFAYRKSDMEFCFVGRQP